MWLSLAFAVLGFVCGVLVHKSDRKKRTRDLRCRNGEHVWSKWDGHRRQCTNCGVFENTEISNNPDLIQVPDGLYCFECQIETRVRYKNGRFSCRDCGLVHRNDY